MSSKQNIFWFRRDLRLQDNAGLFHALNAGLPVQPIFIFDREILDELEDKDDRRVSFIYAALEQMEIELQKEGASLKIYYSTPDKVFKEIAASATVDTVFANHDYEPYATQRDKTIAGLLQTHSIGFKTFKDQVIFEKSEVMKDDGTPYSVFTPYSKKWRSLLKEADLQSFNTPKLFKNFVQSNPHRFPSLKSMGFILNEDITILPQAKKEIIAHYDKTRNTPSVHGTTRLGIHLRFGTVSVRQLAAKALEWNDTFLNELIWREFFMHMLWHQPRLVHESCKTEYDNIKWRNNKKEFELWCAGQTGFPIVDAGMRELNATGFMHNRVRMITASFLVKHLLIDWRWGEAYFARLLNDYELASNNGNWQWVAGCGCDAAPYFRIFNPDAQTKRFDPDLVYIRKWVPELDSFDYPQPMVDHVMARDRCLKTYKAALTAARAAG